MNILKVVSAFFLKDPDLLGRVIMVLVVLAVLTVAILLSGPKPDESLASAMTPTPMPAAASQSTSETETFAYDPYADFAQTTGVVVGTIGLVLILLAGSMIELISDRRTSGKKSG